MALKEDLARLYALQLADSQLARVQEELAGLDDGARTARRAHAARGAAEQAAKELREAEAQLKDRELALEGTETERKSKAARAFGGTVSASKELSALERKIEELDRRKGKLEEEILGLYEQVEALRKAEAEARQQGEELVQRAKRTRAHYQQRSQELQAEAEQLTAQREELAGPVPPALLAQYDKLRQKNQGVGVAAIASGACGFCRTRLPNEYVTMANHGTHMVKCDSCGAILVSAE